MARPLSDGNVTPMRAGGRPTTLPPSSSARGSAGWPRPPHDAPPVLFGAQVGRLAPAALDRPGLALRFVFDL